MADEETIKLVSLNIEMKKHLNSARSFLEKELPDVACLQEVYEEDLRSFAKALGMECVFGQMALLNSAPFGIGMLSLLPIEHIRRLYYKGSEERAKRQVIYDDPQAFHRLLLAATFQKRKNRFTIGTTHFTWTPDGQADDVQREDLQGLLAVLKEVPEIVLCGDFNAPRGGEIFDALSQAYKDNIPSRYATSLDENLHYAREKIRGRSLMVDGLFSTIAYRCLNVRLQEGISDHMAIIAEIDYNHSHA